MCKINGHNLFTYLAQPWNTKALASSNERAKREATAKQQAEETKLANSDGDENAKTATTAQVNKPTKNQTLSSLRVQGNNVGASVGGISPLGLNLGG